MQIIQLCLLPAFCNLAGIELADDRIYDGYDISSEIFNKDRNPREAIYSTGEHRFLHFGREVIKLIS